MKPSIWKNYYDIVILPPKVVSDYAIELSRKFRKYGATLTLGRKHFIPHISLYHIPVASHRFDDFVKGVKWISEKFPGGNLRTLGLRPGKYGYLRVSRPPWLERLHLAILQGTRSYFDWHWGVEKTWQIEKYARQQQAIARKNIQRFGAPFVGATFDPHITLSDELSIPVDVALIRKFKPRYHTFQVKQLYICELGASHSCQRIVKRIPLEK